MLPPAPHAFSDSEAENFSADPYIKRPVAAPASRVRCR